MAEAILDLPPVRGRHRNRSLAKARQNRCVQLAAQGWTYEAIKDELGYANRSTAWRHVQQALAEQQSESTVELRDLAAGRLDALLSACWAKAIEGDLAAVRSCLNVVLAQVKLHDLGPRLVRKAVGGTGRDTSTALVAGVLGDCSARTPPTPTASAKTAPPATTAVRLARSRHSCGGACR